MNNRHLIEVFDDLNNKGFDMTTPLTWSFFFFNKDKSILGQVIKELEGYHYSTLIQKVNDEYRLRVDKKDLLTPIKLEKRIKAFKQLAEYCDVEFDGWEVSR